MIRRRSPFELAALSPGVTRDEDVLRDYVDELKQLYGLPREEVEHRFRRFMDVYHHGSGDGTPEEWARIHGADLEHSFIRISKPFRFRGQDAIIQVLDAIDSHLRSERRPARVLDFGGGFGNDTIAYARAGHAAEYSDLLSLKNSEMVVQRFALRGLDIPVHDSLQLPEETFDAIAAIDVFEHIYDVEETVAQLAGRLAPGGVLCCVNAFSAITHDGDHLDKNRVYVDVFPHMMRAAGFEQVVDAPPFEAWRRERPAGADVAGDIDAFRAALYSASRDRCSARVTELIAELARDPDYALMDLPAPDAIQRPAPDEPATPTVGERGKAAVMRLGARYAPPSVRVAAGRRWAEAKSRSLLHPATPGERLGALADYTAVLRIAQARLASMGR